MSSSRQHQRQLLQKGHCDSPSPPRPTQLDVEQNLTDPAKERVTTTETPPHMSQPGKLPVVRQIDEIIGLKHTLHWRVCVYLFLTHLVQLMNILVDRQWQLNSVKILNSDLCSLQGMAQNCIKQKKMLVIPGHGDKEMHRTGVICSSGIVLHSLALKTVSPCSTACPKQLPF